MPNSKIIAHRDILGNEIKMGDTVVFPSHNQLKVAVVKKINPKMINVVAVGYSQPDKKYPSDMLVVNDPKITLYMMKHTT